MDDNKYELLTNNYSVYSASATVARDFMLEDTALHNIGDTIKIHIVDLEWIVPMIDQVFPKPQFKDSESDTLFYMVIIEWLYINLDIYLDSSVDEYMHDLVGELETDLLNIFKISIDYNPNDFYNGVVNLIRHMYENNVYKDNLTLIGWHNGSTYKLAVI